MAEGGGLLNRYTGNTVSEVRILSAPPLSLGCSHPRELMAKKGGILRHFLHGLIRPHHRESQIPG